MKTHATLLALVVVSGCATTTEQQPKFLDSYVGETGSATLNLDTTRELPLSPEAGWLNAADRGAADGVFRARMRRHVKYKLEPNYVVFEEERRGDRPAGKYFWRDGLLTICMLNATLGSVGDKLAFRFDYDTCAVMTKKPR